MRATLYNEVAVRVFFLLIWESSVVAFSRVSTFFMWQRIPSTTTRSMLINRSKHPKNWQRCFDWYRYEIAKCLINGFTSIVLYCFWHWLGTIVFQWGERTYQSGFFWQSFLTKNPNRKTLLWDTTQAKFSGKNQRTNRRLLEEKLHILFIWAETLNNKISKNSTQ